jgi:glycosyltransferase involved in cell wall biosynthesis
MVTPLAADAARFYRCVDAAALSSVRERYGVPEGPYLLSLCTLEPRKNIPHLLRCFARLAQEPSADGVTLVLAGGKGWMYDGVLELVEQLDALRGRVILTGYVRDEDLAALYTGATAFVYPSLYEGFGLPPLEAMQCGTPVITSNNSSLPEVVGDAGIMVDANDEDDLCQLSSPTQRAEYSRLGMKRAQGFSWQRCAELTVAGYRQALEG